MIATATLLLVIAILCDSTNAFSNLRKKSICGDGASVVYSTIEYPSLFWSKRYSFIVLRAKDEKKGYKFGDFTKGLTKSLIGKNVERITGKPYEFGDLSRTIDSSIKDKVTDLTGNEEYEFGDLSRWADSKVKAQVNEFTGEDSYKFGDITKKVASGQYTLDDLFMVLKGLAIVGASLSPVSGLFPVKVLVDLLNFSLANDAMGKVSSALAVELDKRVKGALLGDRDYKLGDATKRTIAGAVQGFTGKESYEFGDLTKRVVAMYEQDTEVESRPRIGTSNQGTGTASSKEIEPSVLEALDKWDELSDKQQDGLEKIQEYVDIVEKEQLGTGGSQK